MGMGKLSRIVACSFLGLFIFCTLSDASTITSRRQAFRFNCPAFNPMCPCPTFQNGCFVCKCLSAASQRPVTTVATATTTSNGVCPYFPPNCPGTSGCAVFDANFCPVCKCLASQRPVTTVATATTTSNGVCPYFPPNCPGTSGCAVFDANFCPVCKCLASQRPVTTVATATTTWNGVCPYFPLNCPGTSGCAVFDANFCPVCKCLGGTTQASASTTCAKIQCILDCGTPPTYKKDTNGCDMCECLIG